MQNRPRLYAQNRNVCSAPNMDLSNGLAQQQQHLSSPSPNPPMLLHGGHGVNTCNNLSVPSATAPFMGNTLGFAKQQQQQPILDAKPFPICKAFMPAVMEVDQFTLLQQINDS